MNINEVLQEIENRKRLYGLEEFKKCMEAIGNPQKNLKCVHVAGTNGKGSTSNFLFSTLKQKYKVGMFSSPYLIKHNDRIRINTGYISDEKIIYYYKKYNELWLEYNLSSFEIDMFMAVQFFLDEAVDICVFEVGLGGEFDATNIITPLVSVITNISYDHMEFLGKTLVEIAKAKAGIIKENVPLITTEDNAECLAVFQQKCIEKNAPLFIVKDFPNYKKNTKIYYEYQDYKINLATLADYQVKNSVLAINVLNILKQFPLTKTQIEQGISNSIWKGRFELISTKPKIIIDGAHNVAGILELVKALENNKNIKILFSVLKDKEYIKMLEILENHFDNIYFTTFDFHRAFSISDLQQLDLKKATIVEDYQSFFKANENYEGTILVCGSLYFISEIRKRYKGD